MGPIMLDVHGTSLTAEDKEILAHPLVGGLILFARNYHSPEQMLALTANIKKHAHGDILIAVDHEGGRIQRFRQQFSQIPAMAAIWQKADQDLNKAKIIAQQLGLLMALEVQAVGVDISFAPVLDVNSISEVIGDRAFHADIDMVTILATAFIDGMHLAGMKATGKHFPGHGSVKEDSHFALPIDSRSQNDLFAHDLQPFQTLIKINKLDAIMPAHIVFPQVDEQAVGFSRLWLQDILRQKLNFNGVIFSDDLMMKGAAVIGGYCERAEAAQAAGCDMLLICNNRAAVIKTLDQANIYANVTSQLRLQQLLSKSTVQWSQLKQNAVWQEAQNYL